MTSFLDLKPEMLLQMFRRIPGFMVILINKDIRVIFCEGVEKDAFGLNSFKTNSPPLSQILDSHVFQTLLPMLEACFKGAKVSHEMNINRNYYYIQAIPILGDDETVDYGMILFDNITDDKLHSEASRSAKNKAEQLNRAKTEFLAKISHEIRTPLNSIIGFTDQLYKSRLSKSQEKLLNAVKVSSNHLLSIVKETISIAEVESGEITFESRTFFIRDVLRDVFSIERFHAEKKNIELNVINSNRLDMPLIGDVVCLKQILLNLSHNAVKFTEKGQVIVSAEIEKEEQDEVWVLFRVIDTGIGIPEDKLNAIFREFKQVDQAVEMRYGGSGLGLTIANKLVKLQNGMIDVDSKLGEGSEFRVVLPYKTAPKDQAITKDSHTIEPKEIAGRSFLIVDDDEMNRLLAGVIFEQWDVPFDLAENGPQAISFAEKKLYDMILVDIHMPGMDGTEVARRIRNIYKDRKDPYYILAVTANVIERDLKRFLKSGIDGYLLKPFREHELFSVILRYMQGGQDLTRMQGDFMTVSDEPKEKGSVPGYDLTDLRTITKDDSEFFEKMVKTFIDNTESRLMLMEHYLETKNWKEIGEIAHRMIASHKHFRIYSLMEILNKIEEHALYEENYDTIPEMVGELRTLSKDIIDKLKKEIK